MVDDISVTTVVGEISSTIRTNYHSEVVATDTLTLVSSELQRMQHNYFIASHAGIEPNMIKNDKSCTVCIPQRSLDGRPRMAVPAIGSLW